MHEKMLKQFMNNNKVIGYDSEFIVGEKECTKYMKTIFLVIGKQKI